MKLPVIVSFLILAAFSIERPLREGYAVAYFSRDDVNPGIVFEATTRPGIPLAELNDPKKMKVYLESLSKPTKPF